MVIHNGVRQEDFIDAAAAEIECRSVIQGAPRANAREQPIVLAIPKAVNAGRKRIGGLGSARTFSFGPRERRYQPVAVRKARLDPCFRPVAAAPGPRTRAASKKNAPAIAHRIPFRIRRLFRPFVSRIGSTDCGQARKGCKGGKKISPGISSLTGRERPGARWPFGNPTTRNCIFSLDTTRAAAQNPRNFFRGFPVRGDRSGSPRHGKNGASFQRGRKRAVFAGMDCAMH